MRPRPVSSPRPPPQEANVPAALGLSVVQVLRDGHVHRLPSTFLVQGDVIRLRYGDVAPAPIQLVVRPGETPVELEAGASLYPSSLPARSWSVYEAPVFEFVCLTTPVRHVLDTILHTTRPLSVMENQRNLLSRLVMRRLVWALLALSIAVNVLRAGLLPG